MSDWKTRQTLLQKLTDKYDERSWEEFVHFYRPFIYMIARKMKQESHEIDDIVQQITLKAWKNLPELKYDCSKGSFRSWLGRMIYNCILDNIKSRNRYEKRVENAVELNLKKLSKPEIDNFAKEEWETYLSSLAWSNVEGGFSDKVKKSFELSLAGKSTDEIAAELGIKEGSVYVYKKRIKERLIEEIKRLKYDLE
ncbi:MAG: sigma-70 family RNA polymerase sigma factor [Lentisphaeraceae bacterium]|nr:sigma-70 family RNA polymerase sigma factor [Lentisphaeraceae bacterium]